MSGAKGDKSGPDWVKWIVIVLAVLFVGSVLWSFIAETLLPYLAEGNSGAVLRNLVGFPIILLGTAIFVYGGYIFVRDTFGAMQSPQLRANVVQIREGGTSRDAISRARRENFWMLLRSWKAGTLRMVLGFALIALGGWLINL
jgi:hypothetical protein